MNWKSDGEYHWFWLFCLLFLISSFANCNDEEEKEIEEFWKIRKGLENDLKFLQQPGKHEKLAPQLDIPAEISRLIKKNSDALASKAKLTSGRGARKKKANNCQPGYTGQYCENIVCTEKKAIASNGNQAPEWLEYITTSDCKAMGNITIYVDSYVSNKIDVRVFGQRKGVRAEAKLYSPDGSEVTAHVSRLLPNELMQTYWEVVKNFGTGIYTLSVSARAPIPCSVQVSAPSELVVDGGFVSSQHDDLTQELILNNAVEREPLNGVPSYFAFKVNKLPFPGLPFLVSYHKGSLERLAISPVHSRYNCSTPLITVSLQVCTEPGDYKVKIIGLDDNANVWQRIYGYTCNFPPVPAATQPTSGGGGSEPVPAQVDVCYSGGTLIKNTNDSQFGVCYCGVHFIGTQCETKLCDNGGVLDDDMNCICPGDGAYSGSFCEHVNCRATSGLQFVSPERALIFVVRTSQAVADARDKIADAAKHIIDYFEQTSPGRIQKYVAVFFAGGEIQHEQERDVKEHFVETDLRNMQHFIPSNEADEKCTDNVYEALAIALELQATNQYSKSPIFLITDATPSDSSGQASKELFARLSFYRGQLYTILVETEKCKTNTYSEEVKELRRISQFSQGLLARTDFSQLEKTIVTLGQGLENWNQLISDDFLDSCQYAPNDINFFVDTSMSKIAVVTAGGSLGVSIKDPSGNVLSPSHQVLSGNKSDISLTNYAVTVAGNYRLELVKDFKLPCQFRVFGDGPYDLFFGTADHIRSDLDSRQPVFNRKSHLVAHFNNITYLNSENLFAEAIVWTNEALHTNGSRTILYASNGIFRDNCDFNLYFRDWSCPRPGLLFYVNVYITDQSGYTIMRTANGICSSDVPAQQPSTGCINGGVDVGKNEKCVCPGGWTGSRCETIVCQNYGVSKGNYCQCDPSGTTTGTFCETLICDEPPPNVEKHPFKNDGKSLLLLVHDSFNTRPIVSSMVNYISETMQDISMQSRNWIDTYTLASFNDKRYDDLMTSSNPNNIITALSALNERNKNNEELSCNDLLVFESLYSVLADSAKTKRGGIVYIFLLGLPLSDQSLLDELYLLVAEAQIQINIVESSALICQYDITDKKVRIFLELATATGGNFFVLNNQPGKALLTIPTLYSSNLIYENVYDDCSSGQKFYFPIDSQTQTFSVNMFGNFAKDPVYIIPESKDLSVIDLWIDNGSHSRFQQVLRPCNDGWESFKSHCYLFVKKAANWLDAHNNCSGSGSSVVTIFNSEDQDFLLDKIGSDGEMWIGLTDWRTATEKTPVWEWDQPNGIPPLTLKDTGYTSWESTTEPNKYSGTAVRLKKSGWAVENAGSAKPYACIRHSYNIDYSPRGQNVLPHGTWSLTLQTVDVGDENGCAVRIFSQSAIQVFNRFTENNRKDFGYEQMNYGSRKSNMIIAHATGFVPTSMGVPRASLQYAHFYKADKPEITQVQTFDTRYRPRCSYEYVSTPFACTENGYQIAYSGMDDYGYPFQRIKPAVCLQATGNCKNGGVSLNYQCVCPENYSGSRCQTPYCGQYGRLADNGVSCKCNNNWSGDFCQYPICDRKDTGKKLSSSDKTMIIVLDGSWSGNNGALLANIKSVLTSSLNEANNANNKFFSSYVGIVAYDSDVSEVFGSTNISNFAAKFENELKKSSYNSTNGSRSFNKAIINALSRSNIAPLSHLYVIGDAASGDRMLMSQVMNICSKDRITVSYFILNDTGAPGAEPSYFTQTVDSMLSLARQTGGDFYQVADYTQFQQFWAKHLTNQFRSYQVGMVQSSQCSKLVEYIQVPGDSERLMVEVFSPVKPVNVSIYNEQGMLSRWGGGSSNSSTNYFFQLGFRRNLKPGPWKMEITQDASEDPSFCYASVRSISKNEVQTIFSWDVAVDQGSHSNSYRIFPLGYSNAIMATASTGTLLSAQIYDKDEAKLYWASPLRKRIGCTYEYSSIHLFNCNSNASFTIAINGVDADGFPFRRMQHGHCLQY